MNSPTSIKTVLGTNKGTPRSRIWIEGVRLSAHGFAVGTRYNRDIHADGTIYLIADTEGKYRVSGKATKPIIDITGNAVTSNFGDADAVVVNFFTNLITITVEG